MAEVPPPVELDRLVGWLEETTPEDLAAQIPGGALDLAGSLHG